MKPFYLCFFTTVILFSKTFSQVQGINIAVLDLKSNTVQTPELIALSNRVRNELIGTKIYNVIERTEMEEILKEQGFQQTGCVDAACAVEAGQLLVVNKIVVGNIDKVVATYTISLRMVDVETGKIDKTASLDCIECNIDDVLIYSIPNVGRKLLGLKYDENPRELIILKDVKKYKEQKTIGLSLTILGGIGLLVGFGINTATNPTGEEGETHVSAYIISCIGLTGLIVGIAKLAKYNKKLKALSYEKSY